MLHVMKTLGQKRSKPVGKPAEEGKVWQKKESRSGEENGATRDARFGGVESENGSLHLKSLQIAGLERSNQKTEAKSVLRTCRWMGREEDDE